MMPVREAYGKWPTSGEIDIVEARGNKDFKCGDGPQIGKDIKRDVLIMVYDFIGK